MGDDALVGAAARHYPVGREFKGARVALDKWFNNPKTITTAQMSAIIRAAGTLQRPDRSRNATFMYPAAVVALHTCTCISFAPARRRSTMPHLYRRYNDCNGAIMRQTREMFTPRSLTSNSLSWARKSSRQCTSLPFLSR